MAKKTVFTFKDVNDKVLAKFPSKTATKLFNKLKQGTVIDVSIQENNFEDQFVGNYVVKGIPNEPSPPSHDCPQGQHWSDSQNKCVDDIVIPTCGPGEHYDTNLGKCVPDTPQPHDCPQGQHWDDASQKCVDDVITPPTGDVLFDSLTDSKLHDGQVRTVKTEGSIAPCGNGLECRASGSPEIKVNADGTFSLWDNDLGRFYGHTCNYKATMELEVAFWNSGNQTCSLKMRSRHNEGGVPENRFGGYGFAIKSDSWDAKREDYHNVHTSMGSGKLPSSIKVQQYFKVRFTVKDEANGVRQIGEVDGQKVFDKVDNSPKPYMVDAASFAKQSYYWVRQNTTVLAELRIKRLRIIKA